MPDKLVQSDGSVIPIVKIYSLSDGNAQSSGNAVATVNASLTPLGYQQITATTVAFSLSPPGGARIALIQAEAQNLRWRDDGTNPTATVGMLLTVGAAMEYDGNLAAFKGINATAGTIVNVSYYA